MSDQSLVIFDCDGVLVDSELISNRIFCAMLNELGLPVSIEDMFEKFVGLSEEQCMRQISGMLGRPPPETFMKELRARCEPALAKDVKAIPGVRELIQTLSAPYCVASSGTYRKIRLTLNVSGLWSLFEGRVFSTEDVAQPKPAPDLFLHAAQVMGCEVYNTIVIEDTPTGVRAGVAAGMRVFGFCGFTPRHRLIEAGAHETVDSMIELEKRLKYMI